MKVIKTLALTALLLGIILGIAAIIGKLITLIG